MICTMIALVIVMAVIGVLLWIHMLAGGGE